MHSKPTATITKDSCQTIFSSIVMVLVIPCVNRSYNLSSTNLRWFSQTSTTLREKAFHFPKSHSSLSTNVCVKDSLRRPAVPAMLKDRSSIHLKEPMLITASLSNQKLSTASLISSSFPIPSLKVLWSQLTSMLLRILLWYPRMPFWTSPMLCATTTTIGLIPLRFQHHACSPTRSPSTVVRSAIFPQILTSTNCPSICEEALFSVTTLADWLMVLQRRSLSCLKAMTDPIMIQHNNNFYVSPLLH